MIISKKGVLSVFDNLQRRFVTYFILKRYMPKISYCEHKTITILLRE